MRTKHKSTQESPLVAMVKAAESAGLTVEVRISGVQQEVACDKVHLVDVGRLLPSDYADAPYEDDANHADDVNFSLSRALLAAEDVEYEADGTPLCTEAEMCARFGQDWREGLDDFIDAMEIEREKEQLAAAHDPYAWVRDRSGRLV